MANKSLEQLVAEQTGTAAEIAVILNAKTIEVISTELITAGKFIDRLTKNQANEALAALRTDAATNESSALFLSRLESDGLAHIDLRGLRKTDAPAKFVNRLKDMLESMQSPCEVNGLPVVSEVDVQAALDAIANDAKRARLDGIMHGIGQTFNLNPDTTMVDAVKQLARGVLTEEQSTAVVEALGG